MTFNKINYDNIFNRLPYDIFIINNNLDVVYCKTNNEMFIKQRNITSIKEIFNDFKILYI